MSEEPRIIRYSELKRFKRCRRSWMNGYYLGLGLPEFTGDREPKVKRDAGTLVHKDLEHYAETGERPGTWLSRQSPPESPAFAKAWADTFRLAAVMLEGYGEWLEAEGLEMGETTLGTEVELDMPVLNGSAVLRVHIDRLVRSDTWGYDIVEDYKTVDTLSSGQQFATDEQMLTYALVARYHGYDIQRCRHTQLRRVLRTARATPPFYGRQELIPSAEMLDSHLISTEKAIENLLSVVGDLDNGATHHVAYPNNTSTCDWECDFLPICASHDDGSDLDALREAIYVIR